MLFPTPHISTLMVLHSQPSSSQTSRLLIASLLVQVYRSLLIPPNPRGTGLFTRVDWGVPFSLQHLSSTPQFNYAFFL